ncbi:MAG: ATP-binding protein [Pseudomonadota bacterium]
MTERRTSEQTGQTYKSYWPYVILFLFFVFGVVLRPDLFWHLLVLLLAVAGLVAFFPRDEAFTRSDTSEIQSRKNLIEKQRNALIDSLQFPVYLLDRKAILQYSNRSAARAFGSAKNGDRVTILFRQPELKKAIEEALSKGVSLITDYNEPVPDDRWFQVEISPVPEVFSGNGENGRLFLLAFHDQTEAKRIDQMRSDFIANASHELRTPLASLLGYIETIKGPAKDDPKARERFTDVMLDQAGRMSRLVNDLLSLSRIEMKSHVKPSDTVSISEVLSAVAASLNAMAQQMDVEIELNIEEDLQIIGDRDELIQVFENLLENACKYGQEGKRVSVSLERSEEFGDPYALITVKDYGIGIAAEHQHRITERFYRVDVARSREKQGTGLGLAIVKHILNRHGSRLSVKSNPGEGAAFIVRLKVAENLDK